MSSRDREKEERGTGTGLDEGLRETCGEDLLLERGERGIHCPGEGKCSR